MELGILFTIQSIMNYNIVTLLTKNKGLLDTLGNIADSSTIFVYI